MLARRTACSSALDASEKFSQFGEPVEAWVAALPETPSEKVNRSLSDVRKKLKDQFVTLADAVIPVFTVDAKGDEGVGTAFHVGEGVFVTAAHVVSGMNSTRVGLLDQEIPRELIAEKLEHSGLIFREISAASHRDEGIDVAVFKVPDFSFLPVVELGGHLDDWINDRSFLLNEALVLGYPPIPLSIRPVLLAARGEVNAVVDIMGVKHVHFIVSTTARGGFSGGLVLSEWGFALGLVTKSLVKNNLPEELGYLTVLSVEPIYQCLADNGMLTALHRNLFGDLFDRA